MDQEPPPPYKFKFKGIPLPCGDPPSDDCPYAPGLICEAKVEYFCPKCKHVFGAVVANPRIH